MNILAQKNNNFRNAFPIFISLPRTVLLELVWHVLASVNPPVEFWTVTDPQKFYPFSQNKVAAQKGMSISVNLILMEWRFEPRDGRVEFYYGDSAPKLKQFFFQDNGNLVGDPRCTQDPIRLLPKNIRRILETSLFLGLKMLHLKNSLRSER